MGDAPVALDEVLGVFFKAGVDVTHLVSAERFLTRPLPRALLTSLRRHLLVKPGRKSAQPDEVEGFLALLAGARRRRQLHVARLRESAVALAGLQCFRRHRVLTCRVIDFLRSRPKPLAPVDTQFFCTMHGCRAVLRDVVSAIDHFEFEHGDASAVDR
jgi:hypothetical protein